jgi:zinc protease
MMRRVTAPACAVITVGLIAASFVSPAAAQWPTELPPAPLAAHEVKFPPYELRTLPNGLQVVVVLHHEQPVVSMRLIIRAGSALDPKDKLGLARLAASLLDQGTTTMDARRLNDEIDFIGGAIGAGAGTDLTFVNTVVMKDSFEAGLRMLSDIVRQPAFASEEIERQRQQMLSSLQVSFQDPEFIADAVFNRLVYGLHPYGLPESGTPQTLSAITRDDLVAFHRQNFVPNNAILAVVGDLTAEEALGGVTKVLGDWQRREVPVRTIVPPPDPTRRVIVVNKPDAVQTEIRAGHIGIRRNHPDYMPLNLAIRILGGEGANRLHQVLRTERGLTYGAQADMDTLKDAGDFEAETNTRSEATGEVVRLMIDEFSRLQRERVGERELADAKAYLAGSFPLTIETPDAIATQVLNVLFYGLPVDELQSFRERVNAVSPSDVARVASAYLKPDRISLVLVGNAAAFTSQLRAIGFGTYELIEMDQLDLTAPDFKRSARAAGPVGVVPGGTRPSAVVPAYARQSATQSRPPATADPAAAARALLDKVIAAKGGLERLRAVKSLTVRTRGRMTGQEQAVTVEATTYLQYPNRFRNEVKLPEASVVQVFDGTRGWTKDPAGIHDAAPEEIRNIQTNFQRDTIALLLGAYDGVVRVRLLPDVRGDNGTRYHALEMSSRTLDPVVVYVDPETSLVAKQSYVAAGPGQPIVEERFSDYRAVDGVQIAYTATQKAGDRAVERTVTDIRINDALDPRLFTRPVP